MTSVKSAAAKRETRPKNGTNDSVKKGAVKKGSSTTSMSSAKRDFTPHKSLSKATKRMK